MLLKWLGHSCFLLTAKNGTTILTDPFNESLGYNVPKVATDIVTTSHGHFDHSYIKMVGSDYLRLREAGHYLAHNIEITGVKSFHDELNGEKRGSNIIFKFAVDGINICHLGDLGHLPNKEQLDAIGQVDVLLAPVGGIYTIGAVQVKEIMELLNPAITIPMHYKTAALRFGLETIDKLLSLFGENEVKIIPQAELEISKAGLKILPKVVVLGY